MPSNIYYLSHSIYIISEKLQNRKMFLIFPYLNSNTVKPVLETTCIKQSNALTLYHTKPTLNDPETEAF